MITRKLLAALVGLSLAAGTLGTASAQTATPTPTQSASPSDAMAPTTAAKSDVTKKAPIRKHHVRMTSQTHRKHVSLRTTKHVAANHAAHRHLAAGKPAVGKRIGLKVAQHANKRLRLSHLVKRETPKHV